LSVLKKKILSFLLREFYLFWAAGLTIGVYTGSRHDFYNLYIFTAGTAFILLMLILETAITRRLLRYRFISDFSGSSETGSKSGSCRTPIKVFPSDTKRNNLKLAVLIAIPFLILMVVGNLIIGMCQYGQSKKILLSICKDGNFYSNDIVVEGRVSSHPDCSFGDLYFLMEVGSIYVLDHSGNLNRFSAVNEPLSVKLGNAGAESIRRDDYLRLRGNLNKGDLKGFKTGSYSSMFFTAGSGDIERIEYASLFSGMFDLRRRLYHCIKSTFYKSLKIEDACIAEALILGNRNNIPGHLTEYFKRCGVYHLLAISGMHISFFISLIYLLIKKVRPAFVVLWTVVILLIVYNFLVGGKASTVRASVMFVFILLASNWNREYNNRFLLYLSYVIMILFNPYFIYDLGFWMSFGSMAALILIYPVIKKITGNIFPLLKRKRNFLIKIGLVTFSIQAVLFPISAYFFKEFSLISPAANILILPVFYILLFILMASSFTSIIWPPAGCFVLKPSAVFFDYILKIVKILGRPDFFILNFDSYRIKDVVVYYMILLVILSAVLMIIGRAGINKSSQG
jgi:ComEC/Rec2-related protein